MSTQVDIRGNTIIIVGYVGLEGSLEVAKEKNEEMKVYFSKYFMNQVKKCKEYFAALQALDRMKKKEEVNGTDVMISLGADEKCKSLWSALWYLCEAYKTGVEIESSRIPIRQETIEICQFTGLNPYQISSKGCYMIITSQPESVLSELREKDVVSEVIGEITKSRARLVKRGEYIRHLPRPKN